VSAARKFRSGALPRHVTGADVRADGAETAAAGVIADGTTPLAASPIAVTLQFTD